MRGQPFVMAVWVLVAVFPAARGDGLIDKSQKRESETPNLEASLAVHEWYKGGAMSEGSPFKSKSASPVPPRDSEVRYTITLQLSGNKVRVENDQSIWHLETGALHPNPTVSVTNGTVSKVFFSGGIGSDARKHGIILGTSESYDIKSYLLTPLMLHFRGLNEQLAPYPLSKFTRVGGVREAGPTEYLFKIETDNSIEASVDGPKDHATTRLLYTHRGVATERLDTTFEQKESLGFCPTKWVRTRYDSQQRPTQITTVTVEKLGVPPSIAGSQFEIEFPSGTIVEDQRLPYSGPNESLAVADDRGFFSRNRWLLLSACLVALGVVIVLSRRNRKAQGQVESN